MPFDNTSETGGCGTKNTKPSQCDLVSHVPSEKSFGNNGGSLVGAVDGVVMVVWAAVQ